MLSCRLGRKNVSGRVSDGQDRVVVRVCLFVCAVVGIMKRRG